jgi:hypothetical protein
MRKAVIGIILTLLVVACTKSSTDVSTPHLPTIVESTETPRILVNPSLPATTVDTNIRFLDVADSAGVAFKHQRDNSLMPLAGGASVGDFNGDGRLDIYVTNSAGPNALYVNNGDGTFTDTARMAGVDDPGGAGNGAAAGDYDNDGDLDLFVANFHDGLLGTSKLFRNDGAGSFTDITLLAGVEDHDETYRSTGATWGDYDLDGLLDLLVVRHIGEQEPEVFSSHNYSSVARPLSLYHNDGDGTFTNATGALYNGEATHARVKGASFKPSFVDYDNDGDPDIYVVNDFGKKNQANALWRNDGDGQFTDVSIASGTNVALAGMGLAVGDYDNDADFDFYISNMGASVFLENQGLNGFKDVTDSTGTGRGIIPENDNQQDASGIAPKLAAQDMSIGWGTLFTDFNNNGLLDIYLVAGYLDSDPQANLHNQPNALFQNLGNRTFADVSRQAGADDPGIGREVVAADFNNDGLQDLFLVNIGDMNGDSGVSRLLQNTSTNTGSWIDVNLIGTSSNRNGLGARISTTADGVTRIREMGASQGHQSQSVVPVHFGFGNSAELVSIVITWPSGIVQNLTNVPVNQTLTVIEP